MRKTYSKQRKRCERCGKIVSVRKNGALNAHGCPHKFPCVERALLGGISPPAPCKLCEAKQAIAKAPEDRAVPGANPTQAQLGVVP